jgi:hypothetical protein
VGRANRSSKAFGISFADRPKAKTPHISGTAKELHKIIIKILGILV